MELKCVWFSTIRIAVLSVLVVLEATQTTTQACLQQERMALLKIKPFFNYYDDLADWDETVKGSDCCQWRGIECNTTSNRLIGLSLNSTRYWDEGWYLNASLFLPFVELKRLYLPENAIAGCIENEGFEKLSFVLSNLEILDLSDNHLNDSVILSLSELSSLRYLNLAYNRLEGSSYPNGFQWLSRLVNLETLDLSGNSLGNNFMFQDLSHLTNLKELRLSSNQIKNLGFSELNNLKKLKHLDLSWNRIESISIPEETQLKLEQLDLSCNCFRNNTFPFPKGLSSLKSLSMYGNDLQGSLDIKDLSHLINLKELDLSGNQIENLKFSKDDATKMQQLNHLEVLHLDENLLNNSVFALLNEFSNLKYLDISHNQLKGSVDIKELNNLTKLEHLDLSWNRIESISNPEETYLKLEQLDLSGNRFRNNTFRFLKGLSNLKSLIMYGNDLQGSLDITGNLKELDLSRNQIKNLEFSKDDDTELQQLKHLEVLHLDQNLLNNSVFPLLNGFLNLKYLNLSDNHLKGSIDMKVKIIFFHKKYSGSVNKNIKINLLTCLFPDLDALTNLRELYMYRNQLKDFLIHKGCCDLKKLEVLDLSGNAFEGMLPQGLVTFTALRVSDVSGNKFSGNLIPLANLSSLRFLSLSRNYFQIPMSLAPLAKLPNLEFLDLDGNKMVMDPSPHTSLPKFQLKAMKMADCKTSPEPSFEHLTFLYNQYDLRHVDLSGNNFSGTLPIWLLQNNTKLKNLILRSNSFSGPLSLPSVPNFNVSLLDISDNKVQGQIPSNICSTFPRLEWLFLSKNAIEGDIPSCLSDMKDLSTLDLSNNHLSGTVPEELIIKDSLNTLRLSNNNLSGNVVPAILKSNGLKNLYLDGNNFSGEMTNIDVSAFHLPTSLLEIDLSNNKLAGKLPRWIGNLSSLEGLALSNNRFEGSIPMEFCNLNDLRYLDLSQNILSGSIPSCFNPPFIEHVHLHGNRLNCPFPHAFSNSSSLVTLDFSGNNLSGRIPEWIDTLTSLSVLLLNANHLQGGIPVQLCKLNSLSIINLSQNMLSGPIPSCLGNLTLPMTENKILQHGYWVISVGDESTNFGSSIMERAAIDDYPSSYMEEWIEFTTKSGSLSYGGNILMNMTGINLSYNKLTGQIPSELGNLSEIRSLNLSHNNLIGVIPSSFSKLKQVESLDLSYNRLSGEIPNQLIELNSLEVFSVAHNNLSGRIPEPEAQFGTFDERSYEGNLFLCGSMLHKSCSNPDSPSPASHDEEEDSFVDIFIFRVSFLCSYAVMLLATFLILYINPCWRRVWFSFAENCITTCRYSVVGNFLAYYIFRFKRCA